MDLLNTFIGIQTLTVAVLVCLVLKMKQINERLHILEDKHDWKKFSQTRLPSIPTEWD